MDWNIDHRMDPPDYGDHHPFCDIDERPEHTVEECEAILDRLATEAFAAFPWYTLTREYLDEDVWATRPDDNMDELKKSLLHAWDDLAPVGVVPPSADELTPYFEVILEMARVREIRDRAEEWEGAERPCDCWET